MKILVLGGDGYLGWATSMNFAMKGHDVTIVDNMVKRLWEAEMGVEPLFQQPPLKRRIKRFEELTGKSINLHIGDIAENPRVVYKIMDAVKPDCLVHYAEQPSAPFSMANRDACIETQRNNILGTLNVMFAMQSVVPNAHLVKLGTMGEYGTPNIDIEEGWIEIEHKGRKDRVLYPKKPGSFYHLSKVHDSANLEFACRVWDMRVTDLNQGVVYGISTDETDLHPDLETSFHYDAVFGTVLNRFIVQTVAGSPMTVYGGGTQTRGYLNIRDTIRCVELAAENPADAGEFRVFNQMTQQFSVIELAERVKSVAATMGYDPQISFVENPRVEQEGHYYNAVHTSLPKLGLEPTLLTDTILKDMISRVAPFKDRIDKATFQPGVRWRQR